ncbi:aminoglycoside phosphotransferase family protein [Enterococcus sp. LJL51]|uniref:aminoglycoside phosphotransferase family protein n=1 Tax=Enterococcus sp. LJL51 TaxID=3416656 RepID=UPI003CE7C32D
MPSGEAYAPQIEKEAAWLPYLGKELSLSITSQVALGQRDSLFPYPWSVNQWLEGDILTKENVDSEVLALELGNFLNELKEIDASSGPAAGQHNFYRGGELQIYNNEVIEGIQYLSEVYDPDKLTALWEAALRTQWQHSPVWVHGDIAPGNLLVNTGHLTAVIDFGILGTGDPACDYAMSWSFFDQPSRELFLKTLPCDEGTRLRAMGWALWKAIITYHDQQLLLHQQAVHTISEIMTEYQSFV